MLKTVLVGCASLLAMSEGMAANADWHAARDIERVAEQRVADDRGLGTADGHVKADALDPSLRVSQCDVPLQTRYPGPMNGPRTTVGVICPSAQRWQIYVSVRIVAWKPVVTLATHLPRGHIIEAKDLTVRRTDVSTMTLGYFSDPEAVVGRRLKRSIAAGMPLPPSAVSARKDVSKGQTVSLIVQIAGGHIRMAGRALTDAAVGERVRVENLSSGRTIEGTLQKDGQVLISR